MLKRTISIALAIVLVTSAVTFVMPVERAAAEMSTKEKSKAKAGMSGKERRQKCSAEWKDAKAAGKTANVKWPKFYSDCNKRLKAQAA